MTTWAVPARRGHCCCGPTACAVTVHDAFTPAGTRDPGVPAVTVGAGTRWLEAYQALAAATQGQQVVYSVSGLANTTHTLQVTKTGGSYMIVDAIGDGHHHGRRESVQAQAVAGDGEGVIAGREGARDFGNTSDARGGHRPVGLQRPGQPGIPVRARLGRLRRVAGPELRPGRNRVRELHLPGSHGHRAGTRQRVHGQPVKTRAAVRRLLVVPEPEQRAVPGRLRRGRQPGPATRPVAQEPARHKPGLQSLSRPHVISAPDPVRSRPAAGTDRRLAFGA